ncbi:MAG: hypothetical protein AB1798_00990 [Spirochaetota bacterium]
MSGDTRTGVVMLGVIILLVLFPSCSDFKYFKYENNTYNFRVDIPARYKNIEHREEVIDTAAGRLKMDFYLISGDNKLYMIGALRHNLPKMDKDAAMASLIAARDKLVKDALILQKSEYTVNGFPAVAFRYKKRENNTDYYAQAMITETQSIQFQTQVLAAEEFRLNEPDVARFQMSFKYSGF